MVSIALFTPEGIAAALYYIVHSTFAAAALFLIADLARAGRENLNLTAQPPIAGGVLTAAMFFVAAIAMAGLPPLSGFLGKLLILDAAFDTAMMPWIWAVVLGASLISVVGFARAGSTVFWKSKGVVVPEDAEIAAPPAALSYVAVGGLITMLVAHTVFAGPATAYTTAIARELFAPAVYVSTVLETPGKLSGDKDDGHGHDDHDDRAETDDHAADKDDGH
jgi:multicomponent K+:H+ antiporter subunit D